jgi:hypothetical protein
LAALLFGLWFPIAMASRRRATGLAATRLFLRASSIAVTVAVCDSTQQH